MAAGIHCKRNNAQMLVHFLSNQNLPLLTRGRVYLIYESYAA